jgi:hypothetical protein
VSSSRSGPKTERSGGAPKPGSKGAVCVRKASPSFGRLRARQAVQLVSKARPSWQRRLSDVHLEEDEVFVDGYDGTLDGVKVRVTAVLERTCVYVDRTGDKRLVSKKDIWVEAGKLPIRRRGIR